MKQSEMHSENTWGLRGTHINYDNLFKQKEKKISKLYKFKW